VRAMPQDVLSLPLAAQLLPQPPAGEDEDPAAAAAAYFAALRAQLGAPQRAPRNFHTAHISLCVCAQRRSGWKGVRSRRTSSASVH
jgi:hypothetical protein